MSAHDNNEQITWDLVTKTMREEFMTLSEALSYLENNEHTKSEASPCAKPKDKRKSSKEKNETRTHTS